VPLGPVLGGVLGGLLLMALATGALAAVRRSRQRKSGQLTMLSNSAALEDRDSREGRPWAAPRAASQVRPLPPSPPAAPNAPMHPVQILSFPLSRRAIPMR
jgi:hypothetical protein